MESHRPIIKKWNKVAVLIIHWVAEREPLSTSGREIQLWLSDLVKDHKGLSEEFVRPLHARASHRRANITIPYATILSSAQKGYRSTKPDDYPSTDTTKAAALGFAKPASGKRLLSTLADGSKPSLSPLAGVSMTNGVFGPRDKRFPPATQASSGIAICRRPLRVTNPATATATAVLAPWTRLLARFPRKM